MRQRKTYGFTLIELMITVAIVGILAAIAYPSYLDQVRKSRRADAQSALLQAANRQERLYTTQYSYTQNLADLGMAAETENEAYTLNIDSADANGFQISANAQNDQTNDDCRKLTINQRGQKTANDAAVGAAISQQCW
ncbi:type IV pilus assembly protein PilE [Salinisphaera sp. C84B14]|uniref:type IV pilin protein n=1 Tax=Salinisphaera sp. C84B14 TaxID=1304155 RepID=UPI003341BBEA